MGSGKGQNGIEFGAARAGKPRSTGSETPTSSAGQQNVEEKAAGTASRDIRAETQDARAAALQAGLTSVVFRADPARVVRQAAVARVADRAEDSAGSGFEEP